MRVSGHIRFEEPPTSLEGAIVQVRLLDVSRVDAAAPALAEQRIGPLAPGAEALAYALEAPPPDPRGSYIVAAEVALDGASYRTMESFPVDPHLDQVELSVRVRRA